MGDSRSRYEYSPRNERLLWALVAIGVGLRLWQYLADTSMWFDEFSIARNITERSLGQLLTQPLGFEQTAPLGFLAILKLSSRLLGSSDMALRLFPILCGVASVFVFWRVAERTLSGSAVPIAVALFALSPPLIRYSVELKQYGCDVVAILLLTLVALNLCARTPTIRECVRAGLIGAFTILFSQTAVLVLAGIGAALTLRFVLRYRELPRRIVLVTVPIWACAALIGLFIARRYMTAHTMEFMHWFWRTRLGFLPLPTSANGFALWTRDRFTQFFDAMSGLSAAARVHDTDARWIRGALAQTRCRADFARPHPRDVRRGDRAAISVSRARRALFAPVAADRCGGRCGMDRRSPVRH